VSCPEIGLHKLKLKMDKKETNLGSVIMGITRRRYTEELKLHICKEHIEEGTGLLELVKKYNLSTHSLIHGWLRKFGYVSSPDKPSNKPVYIVGLDNYNQMATDNTQTSSSLNESPEDQSEIARLKKELLEAKIKAEGFERMIEIAEEQFKIPIRKK